MNSKKQTTNYELRTLNFVQSNLNDYAKRTQFPKPKTNVSSCFKMNYEQITMNYVIQNKPNRTQPVVSKVEPVSKAERLDGAGELWGWIAGINQES